MQTSQLVHSMYMRDSLCLCCKKNRLSLSLAQSKFLSLRKYKKSHLAEFPLDGYMLQIIFFLVYLHTENKTNT